MEVEVVVDIVEVEVDNKFVQVSDLVVVDMVAVDMSVVDMIAADMVVVVVVDKLEEGHHPLKK